MDQTAETLTFEINEELNALRLDKALVQLCPEFSRARLQSLIKGGHLQFNGKVLKKGSHLVEEGDRLEISLPPLEVAEPAPQDIPLDIIYEDDDLLVINKAVGMVVHPGAGNRDCTMVNALLHHCGDSLSGIGGVQRPGIVHRLDKETSGLIVVAKHDKAHQGLAAQLEDRSLSRVYTALALKVPVPIKGAIKRAIGRHPSNRTKMCAVNEKARGGKEALTHYLVKENYRDALSLVECRLSTGRTHQIRVHMDFMGHPLIGDPLYGPQPTALNAALKRGEFSEAAAQACREFPRQALHARQIRFIHPILGNEMSFEAPYPDDFEALISIINQ